jgi:hypothetical protein
VIIEIISLDIGVFVDVIVGVQRLRARANECRARPLARHNYLREIVYDRLNELILVSFVEIALIRIGRHLTPLD